jgi:hypothetical protein
MDREWEWGERAQSSKAASQPYAHVIVIIVSEANEYNNDRIQRVEYNAFQDILMRATTIIDQTNLLIVNRQWASIHYQS